MIRSCKGITALVTGASSGIGKAIAYELAQKGAHLVLAARNLQKLQRVADNLQKEHKVQVWTYSCDLSRQENCEKLFQFTQQNNIAVDMLVNNAGLAHHRPFTDHDPQVLEAMLKVNIEALVTLTRLFLPRMQQQKTGGILNVASIAGFQPIPNLSVYAATKAFVLSFSEALWLECLKYDVRVFCVCPGNTITDFHQVAGIENEKIFFSATAEDLAKFAVEKFFKGRRPSGIFGPWNKLMIYAERLVPRAAVVFFTGLIYQQKGNAGI